MNMKEAYLKVLGLDQKPLEESKVTVERAAWVPTSIAEDQVEAFMEAVKSALAEKQDVVQFEGKKWKVSEKKSCDDESEEDDEEIKGGDDEIIPSSKKSVKEELTDKQKKIDHNKNGKIDGEDLAKLRKEDTSIEEETDDEHYEKQSPKMKDAINLHLRKGKSYRDAVKAARVHVKEEKYATLIATLSEGGLPQEEIDGIIARLEEASHVGTGGPAPADAQEMGDNLSDGEIDFVEKHEVEVIDGTPEKPDFDKDLDKAEEPKAQGAGKVEVDGQKAAEKQPVTTTKAAVPTTK